jgi:L-threonylcarbamoyladenylate synthase
MKEDLKNALDALKRGGVILYPTDTIWGIGCDATNTKAIERIYAIKKRTDSKSMLILVDEAWRINDYVNDIPDVALQLVEITDKPLTIIYTGARNISQSILGVNDSIGIRVTSDEFCKKLIKSLNKPIVSTSANISGSQSPANFSEISKDVIESVDYVVQWRQNDKNKSVPSSIIKIGPKGEVEIIRK